MLARVPASENDAGGLPLRAMTTPVRAGTVTEGRPEVPLPYSWSEPDGPTSVSFSDPRTFPFASLMKIAAATVGSGFGTAIGRAPFDEFSWSSETRACALILETMPPKPMNQGRFVSVALMSTYFAAQGEPFGSVPSPYVASPKYPAELIKMCIL